jgi:Spy/CpxP family protein refolding chaperone
MMRTFNRYLGTLALMSVAAAGFAQAPTSSPEAEPPVAAHATGHHGCGPMREHPLLRVLHKLQLTAAQKTQIKSICEATRPNAESLAKSMHENLEALISTPPSDARYQALLETAKANALEHIKLLSDTQAKIYAVLTPEQQAKIPEIVAAEKAKREAWRSRHAAPAQTPQ